MFFITGKRSPKGLLRRFPRISASSNLTWGRIFSLLHVKGLNVFYGDIQAIREVSLSISPGEIVSLLGGNGAGKTTTLRTISGLLRPKSGSILFEGIEIHRLPPHRVVGMGLSQVPEG